MARSEMPRRASWRSSVISFSSRESMIYRFDKQKCQFDKPSCFICQFVLFAPPASSALTGGWRRWRRRRMQCTILGAPVQVGSGRMGCEMGPSALRTAGLAAALSELGHTATDLGTVTLGTIRQIDHKNTALKALPEISAWTAAIAEASYAASADGMPIFLGGDHAISAG